MRVLGLDLEGMNVDIKKGVNTKLDRITEIGAVLWDWEKKQPLKMFSHLIDEDDRPDITEENTAITGITEEMLEEFGVAGVGVADVLKQLSSLMLKADYIMAHNGGNHLRPNEGYDYQMLKATFDRHKVPWPETVWIDTLTDLEFPEHILRHTKGRKDMMSLEHAHGFINPFPHRAVTDVLSMLKIASNYGIERMFTLANSPMATLVWATGYPPRGSSPEVMAKFEKDKETARTNRFFWQPDAKEWTKRVKKLHIEEGLYASIELDFTTREDKVLEQPEDDVCPF